MEQTKQPAQKMDDAEIKKLENKSQSRRRNN
jgi:hypothetical protein